jgi:hypothetical protein
MAEQIFLCGNGGLFCDNYAVGGGTLIGQQTFTQFPCFTVDTPRLEAMSLGKKGFSFRLASLRAQWAKCTPPPDFESAMAVDCDLVSW